MKGLFCFDGPMYCDVNGIYCNTTLTNDVFNRYLKVVDRLALAIRTFHIDDSFKEANLNEVKLDNIEMVECPNLNSIKGTIFERKSTYQTLFKLVSESDLIFARMPSVISNMVIKIARKLKKPYIVEVGGCVWDAYWNHGFQGKLIAPYLFYQTRKSIKNAPFGLYVTEKFLQNRYPMNGRNAACSNVNLPKSENKVLIQRLEKIKNKSLETPIVIGTTAAINVRYKGQAYIIEAIARLNKEGFNFEYELVGGGGANYLKSIAKKFGVEDKVRFKGVMLHQNVIDWLDGIDIYAQPSKQEGLPRALVEAISRALPAIGSTTAGIPEIISGDVIFENGDIKSIVEILKNLNAEKMIELANINFDKSKEFEFGKIEERRQKIFNEYAEYVANLIN